MFFYSKKFYVHFVDEYLTDQAQTSYEFYPYLVSTITARLQMHFSKL